MYVTHRVISEMFLENIFLNVLLKRVRTRKIMAQGNNFFYLKQDL